MINKTRRIVLSSPSQVSGDSDSEQSWAEFEGIADAEGSSSPGGVNFAVVVPREQEASSEVEGVPSGELSFASSVISSNAIEFQQWFVLHANVGRRRWLHRWVIGPA